MDAAKAAIAYEKPRLAATELSGGLGIKTHEDWVRELQDSVAQAVTNIEEHEGASLSRQPAPLDRSLSKPCSLD